MTTLKQIAVYCGSSSGTNEIYARQAYLLGETLAQENIAIVYGGGKVGMMKHVADGALSRGGKVIGVIPAFLAKKEIMHDKATDMIVVETMHERKHLMSELCDGVIALPGGYGTMDELFDMLTWEQLGLHKKPIGLLNINGFYDALIALIKTMTHEGFLKESNRDLLLLSDQIPDLLNQIKSFTALYTPKWL